MNAVGQAVVQAMVMPLITTKIAYDAAYYAEAAYDLRKEILTEPPIPVLPAVELFKKYFPKGDASNSVDACFRETTDPEVAAVLKDVCNYSLAVEERGEKIAVKKRAFSEKFFKGVIQTALAVGATIYSFFLCRRARQMYNEHDE